MTNIYTLLLMSASGTIMYLLSILFGKRIRHYVWQYAMLITSVVMLLAPIQKILEIPKIFKVTVPRTINAADMRAAQSAARTPVSAAEIITALWLIGVLIFAARTAFKYIKTSAALRQITEDCYDEKVLNVYFNVCRRLSVRRNITLRGSKYLNSPLLFGTVKPMIVIPDKNFSEKELEMILTHELTHYKHRDLWIALAASAARCVHWFNPAAYFIGKSVSEVCELFCDETVVKSLDSSDKRAYGNLILSVIERDLSSKLAYTTSMASAKNSIQRRLRKIVEFKTQTKASVIAGIMTVCACAVSSLTAFGFETAAEVIPEEIKRIAPITIPTAAPETTPIPMVKPEPDSGKAIAMPNTASEETPKKASVKAPDAARPETEIPQTAESYYEPSDEVYETEEYAPEAVQAPEPPDAAEASDITETPDVTDAPITSYVFNADFDESAELQSETFRAENGTKLSISKVNGSKDVAVSVHNAATGEIIYDEREDKTHDRFSMSVPEGGEYYVTAYSEDGGNSGIYIYGE